MSSKRNKYFTQNLSIRLTTIYILMFSISFAIVFSFSYFMLIQSMEDRDQKLLDAKFAEYSAIYNRSGLHELKTYLISHNLKFGSSPFLVRLENANGETLFMHIPDQLRPVNFKTIEGALKNVTDSSVLFTTRDGLEDDDNYEISSQILPDGIKLQIAASTDDRDDLIERFKNVNLLATIVLVFLGGLGGILFSRQALLPIRRLIETVRQVQAGDLKARVPDINSNDELEELSTLFNQMIGKIQLLVSSMQEALDNVAHDLRTPLTRIRSSAELALLKNSDIEQCREALNDCLSDSEEIITLLNSLMDQSEAQAGLLKLKKTSVKASEIIHKIEDVYQLSAEEKGINLVVRVTNDFEFSADVSRSKQALANLVDNAIKYTSSQGTVIISASVKDGVGVISVADSGMGISPDDIPRIWDRLYRGDQSRSQKGLGLGLSIVKSIGQAHGWNLSVRSNPGTGSVFNIEVGSVA